MDEKIVLQIPLKNEYLTTVRLTTGGVCSLASIDVETSEDCKVCVTESLLLLKRNGYLSAEIGFLCRGGLSVTVTGKDKAGEISPSEEDEISCVLLSALVDNLNMEHDESGISALSFGFES